MNTYLEKTAGVGICVSFAQDFTIGLHKKNIIEMTVMPPEF